MRKQIKNLLLITILACMAVPSWAQSTQGKEFWVSSSLVCSPDKATPTPYIAISAEKACTVNIQGGVGNAINITQKVAAGSWNEFGNGNTSQTDPTAGMVKVPMDASKWYPTTMSNANNVYTLAGQKNMYGLHITATENISVYVILSSLHSMDASNILPMTALGSEYYTQDYWSKVKSDFPDAVGLTTILGTEDGTKIDIEPNGIPYGRNDASSFQIELNKGQTYYLVTQKGDRLAGSHIKAKDGRKIAIYCGVPITNVPTGIAARDCLFEQPMPIEYWGTQFIATRSLEKNGNLIGITATQRGTEIKVDGYTQSYINEGETYYIMLQSAGDPNGNKPGESPIDLVVTADAAFIETSCPCAVYNYDTGNSYKGKTIDEIVGGKGDPSSVWVSPVQQKINRITFGTCYTSKTEDHFLNVVTETATCQNTTLTALFGANELDKTDLLVWTPVPGNPTFSYARAHIGTPSTKQYSVFRLENAKGFIATVYGNGEDESYAYSAGSAAVEQGVIVGGETFTNGYRSETKFCCGTELTFDSKVGTDEITRVDWNFGDGTTDYNGEPVTTHTYNIPGWYDVTADLYGHQVCTDEDNIWLGTVSFTFRIWRHDTIVVPPSPDDKVCFDTLGSASTQQFIEEHGEHGLDTLYYYLANGKRQILNPDAPCEEDRRLSLVPYGLATTYNYSAQGRDSIYVNGQWYYPETLPADGIIKWTIDNGNQYGCDSIVTCYAKIITCLDLKVTNNPDEQHICLYEENSLVVVYEKIKGEIKDEKAVFTISELPSFKADIPISNSNVKGTLLLPLDAIKTPGIYTGHLKLDDPICIDQPWDFTINFAVYYPSTIFKFKYNNILAVYKPGFGGNSELKKDFTAYQWYRNGAPILGATESILYLGNGVSFNTGDEVYVELTDKNGLTLPSCSQILEVPDFIPQSNNAPAQKMIRHQKIVIMRDEKTYNIYGQRVQ
jgi:hypothetical protein